MDAKSRIADSGWHVLEGPLSGARWSEVTGANGRICPARFDRRFLSLANGCYAGLRSFSAFALFPASLTDRASSEGHIEAGL